MNTWKPTLNEVGVPAEIGAGISDGTSATHFDRMTAQQKLIRERFVHEYLFDFSETNAAKRCGFAGSEAVEVGRKLMDEVAVQRLIAERMRAYDPAKEVTMGRVVAGLMKEANDRGIGSSHSARVASYMGVAKIMALGESNKTETNVHLGGVMVVPAPCATPEQWEAMARNSQATLKASAAD